MLGNSPARRSPSASLLRDDFCWPSRTCRGDRGTTSHRQGMETACLVRERSMRRSVPLTGGMSVKTVTGWLAVAFVIWWVIEQPADAAHVVHNIGVFLG